MVHRHLQADKSIAEQHISSIAQETPAETMSAILSGFVLQNNFSSHSNLDDGFWQEPSTMKPKLAASASLDAEARACDTTAAAALTTKHSIAHPRQKSMQCHYAAPGT
jgi:ABC-type uncharacterized transport system YnjBCD substrate-binding protein